MNLTSYLELSIKSDELVTLFEEHDVDVTYSYDRLHEGTKDRYFASIPELGLQFCFDTNQLLKTIFIYTQDEEKFRAANASDFGLTSFQSKSEAIDFSIKGGLSYREGEADFLGEPRSWIKQSFKNYTVHYEFRRGVLCLITVQSEVS